MAEARCAGGGDGALQETGFGHVHRLRSAHAIGAAALERSRHFIEIMRIIQLAMAVDQDDQVAARRLHGNVASAARPAPRVVKQPEVDMIEHHLGDDISCGVRRFTVGDENLEAVRRIVLVQELVVGCCR